MITVKEGELFGAPHYQVCVNGISVAGLRDKSDADKLAKALQVNDVETALCILVKENEKAIEERKPSSSFGKIDKIVTKACRKVGIKDS